MRGYETVASACVAVDRMNHILQDVVVRRSETFDKRFDDRRGDLVCSEDNQGDEDHSHQALRTLALEDHPKNSHEERQPSRCLRSEIEEDVEEVVIKTVEPKCQLLIEKR